MSYDIEELLKSYFLGSNFPDDVRVVYIPIRRLATGKGFVVTGLPKLPSLPRRENDTLGSWCDESIELNPYMSHDGIFVVAGYGELSKTLLIGKLIDE